MMKSLNTEIYLIRKKLRGVVSRFLIHLGILDKFILIRLDGGICSQMHQYLLGYYFQEKGYKVKYDLTWYKQWGKDLNGINIMNFDLLKCFKTIPFKEVSSFEYKMYTPFDNYGNVLDKDHKYDWMYCKPPMYLNGYYNTPVSIDKIIPHIFRVDYNVLSEQSKNVLTTITKKKCSVAIHIRRGDLSSFLPTYGNPVTEDYFNHAISYISERYPHPYYFIFSDEPFWCKTELLHRLNIEDNRYEIVDVNGTDRGYMDLLLISACHHYISSKGSLGKWGGLLSTYEDSIITIFDDEQERRKWEGKSSKIVFLN